MAHLTCWILLQKVQRWIKHGPSYLQSLHCFPLVSLSTTFNYSTSIFHKVSRTSPFLLTSAVTRDMGSLHVPTMVPQTWPPGWPLCFQFIGVTFWSRTFTISPDRQKVTSIPSTVIGTWMERDQDYEMGDPESGPSGQRPLGDLRPVTTLCHWASGSDL